MGVRVEGQGLREYGEGNRVRVKGFGTVMQRSPPIIILLIYIRAVIYTTGHLCNIIVFYCLEQRHLAPGREGEGLGNNTEESAKTGEREREREDKTVFETKRETRGQDKDRKQQDPRRRQETRATGLSHTEREREQKRVREKDKSGTQGRRRERR